MTNMIFDIRDDAIEDHRSQNVDLVTVNDDNIMEPNPIVVMADIEEAYGTVVAAMEEIDTLSKIKAVLANRPVSKSTIKIGQLSMENVKKRLNIFELTGISTESISDNVENNRKAAVESIGSFVTAIYQAIAKVLRRIIAFVKNLFTKKISEKTNEKIKEGLSELLERFEKAQKDGSLVLVNSSDKKEMLEIISGRHRSLRHSNKLLTLEELTKHLEGIKLAAAITTGLSKVFTGCIDKSLAAMLVYSSGSINEEKFEKEILSSIETYNNAIEDGVRNDSSLKGMLSKDDLGYYNQHSNCNFKPTGLVYDGRIHFFYDKIIQNSKGDSKLYHLTSEEIPDCELNAEALPLNNFITYIYRTEHAFKEAAYAVNFIHDELESNQGIQDKTAKMLEELSNKAHSEDGDSIKDFINSNFFALLNSNMAMFNQAYLATEAVKAHLSYIKDLARLYQPK